MNGVELSTVVGLRVLHRAWSTRQREWAGNRPTPCSNWPRRATAGNLSTVRGPVHAGRRQTVRIVRGSVPRAAGWAGGPVLHRAWKPVPMPDGLATLSYTCSSGLPMPDGWQPVLHRAQPVRAPDVANPSYTVQVRLERWTKAPVLGTVRGSNSCRDGYNQPTPACPFTCRTVSNPSYTVRGSALLCRTGWQPSARGKGVQSTCRTGCQPVLQFSSRWNTFQDLSPVQAWPPPRSSKNGATSPATATTSPSEPRHRGARALRLQ